MPNIEEIIEEAGEIIENIDGATGTIEEIIPELPDIANITSQITSDGSLIIIGVAAVVVAVATTLTVGKVSQENAFKNAARLQAFYTQASGNMKAVNKIHGMQLRLDALKLAKNPDEKAIKRATEELALYKENLRKLVKGMVNLDKKFKQPIAENEIKITTEKYLKNAGRARRIGFKKLYKLPFQESYKKNIHKAETKYNIYSVKNPDKKGYEKGLKSAKSKYDRLRSNALDPTKITAEIPSMLGKDESIQIHYRCVASTDDATKKIFKLVNMQYPDIGTSKVFGCRISFGTESDKRPIFCNFNDERGYELLRASLIQEAYMAYLQTNDKESFLPIKIEDKKGAGKKLVAERIDNPEKFKKLYEESKKFLDLLLVKESPINIYESVKPETQAEKPKDPIVTEEKTSSQEHAENWSDLFK